MYRIVQIFLYTWSSSKYSIYCRIGANIRS
nr:MAG TPA: hypothetical protein [Bacteriophage sp.]DAL65278.1 MAG TPA_asm: hypothetical protein [Caudoviricetes sp.]